MECMHYWRYVTESWCMVDENSEDVVIKKMHQLVHHKEDYYNNQCVP